MDDLRPIFHELGESGIASVTAAFYERVKEDDILGPMYPDDDWEGAEKRLRDFLIFRFGGPARYIEERGHPRLRARHFPFAIDSDARDRWIALMRDAMDETPMSDETYQLMLGFLAHVANFLRNRPDTPS
jgi:hemoglobin